MVSIWKLGMSWDESQLFFGSGPNLILGGIPDYLREKPAFLNSGDFDAVRRVQAETGRRVFVAENYYYKPLAMRLRESVTSDMLGEILFITPRIPGQPRLEMLPLMSIPDSGSDPPGFSASVI